MNCFLVLVTIERKGSEEEKTKRVLKLWRERERCNVGVKGGESGFEEHVGD